MKITTEYITLGQFLKLTDLFDSGGHIKALISELDITVNGEHENRRGKKLYPGDIVIVEGHQFVIENA